MEIKRWLNNLFSPLISKEDWIELPIVLSPDVMHPAKFYFRHIGRTTSSEKLRQSTTVSMVIKYFQCTRQFLPLIAQREKTTELDKTDTKVRAKAMKTLSGSGNFDDKFIRKYRAIPVS